MSIARRRCRSRGHVWLVLVGAAVLCLVPSVGAQAATTTSGAPTVAYGGDSVVTGQQLPPYGLSFRLKHVWTGRAGVARICHYDFRRWSGGSKAYGGKLDWTMSTTKTYAI